MGDQKIKQFPVCFFINWFKKEQTNKFLISIRKDYAHFYKYLL